MFRKRGLSGVVTTLIIVLLVLVAVGIIWAVVKNVVQRGAEQVDLGQFTLDLQIKKAQVQNGNVTVVVVKRNAGNGNFVGMNFIFSDGQNSEIIRQNASLQELEEKSFTFTLTKISTNNLKTVSVAPIYQLDSGKETVGNTVATFDVPKSGTGTGAATGNFATLGYSGAGKKQYSVSSQSQNVVKFTKAIVDPLDVLPGDNQTFTVYVYSPYNITSVTSATELDNSTLNLDFVKTGTDLQNSSIEIWSINWIVNDTHTIEYKTIIIATDSQGNSNTVSLTWTDSCQSAITHGSDSTLSTSCTTGANSVAGIDGGSLTIGAGVGITIDSGSQFIFNSGKSITITASGASIIATSGGSFGNGNLYYYDSDSDSAAVNSTLILSGNTRAKDTSVTNDCDDGNSSVFYNGYGYDDDTDDYGSQSVAGCYNGPSFTATLGFDACPGDSAHWLEGTCV